MRRILSSELEAPSPAGASSAASGLKLPALKAGWQSLKERLGIARASDTPTSHVRRQEPQDSDQDSDDDFDEIKFFSNDKRGAPAVPSGGGGRGKSSTSGGGDPGLLVLRSGDFGAILTSDSGQTTPKRERFASVSSKVLQMRATTDSTMRGTGYGMNGQLLSSSPTAVDAAGNALSPDGGLTASQSLRNGLSSNRGAWGDGGGGGPTLKVPSDTVPTASRRDSGTPGTSAPTTPSSARRPTSDAWGASTSHPHSQPHSVVARGLSSSATIPHAREPALSSSGQQLLAVSPVLPPLMRRSEWVMEDYDISRLMARTSSYVLQRATCMHSGLPVCLKTYNMAAFSRESFNMLRQEVELQARLVHNNLLKVFAAFVDDGQLAIVYEHAPRGDLGAVMERFTLGTAEVTEVVIRPLLKALAFMHSRGVCHGNLKGDCIMFMQDWRLAITGLASATNFAAASRSRRHRHEGSDSFSHPQPHHRGSGSVRSAGMPLPGASSRSSRSNMSAAAATASLLNTAPDLSSYGSRSGYGAEDGSSSHGGGPDIDYYSDPDFTTKAGADVAMVGRLMYELLVGSPPPIRLVGVDEDEDANDALLDEGDSDESSDGPGSPGRPRSQARLVSSPEELPFPSSVAPQARRFIRSMLAREAFDRPTASDLLRDPWLLSAAQTARRRSSEMRR
ncbi:hypothetical protein HYH02_007637 [Chlamydomonas schloesseri]|uniref:Protein kinase domain-containing protein n=1 Tax=Chlamydomonas schloesseri TaxID=2026947 RepID=A0A836B4F3_9CHLO|nr:hypothetical protein HYH02_007637 [Chlamydomonas schloesseri]|eukprot:KAG2447307.1 hypothetical protein HYH02_007637 [Chlamydomonas schloesseri]